MSVPFQCVGCMHDFKTLSRLNAHDETRCREAQRLLEVKRSMKTYFHCSFKGCRRKVSHFDVHEGTKKGDGWSELADQQVMRDTLYLCPIHSEETRAYVEEGGGSKADESQNRSAFHIVDVIDQPRRKR